MVWMGHREEQKTGEVSEAQGRGGPGRPQTDQNKQHCAQTVTHGKVQDI